MNDNVILSLSGTEARMLRVAIKNQQLINLRNGDNESPTLAHIAAVIDDRLNRKPSQ